MNYQLVKQLIDAGFPYRSTVAGDNDGKHYHVDFVDPKGNSRYSMIPREDWALDEDSLRVPTLAELMAACGKPFNLIGYEGSECEWSAHHNTDTYGGEVGYGPTPEEAVARLYLALKTNG